MAAFAKADRLRVDLVLLDYVYMYHGSPNQSVRELTIGECSDSLFVLLIK